MKTISLKLSERLDQQLSTLAEAHKTTKSQVLREAIAAYLIKSKAESPGFCLANAGDLVGCVTGAEDLSCNKQYLNGFGE